MALTYFGQSFSIRVFSSMFDVKQRKFMSSVLNSKNISKNIDLEGEIERQIKRDWPQIFTHQNSGDLSLNMLRENAFLSFSPICDECYYCDDQVKRSETQIQLLKSLIWLTFITNSFDKVRSYFLIDTDLELMFLEEIYSRQSSMSVTVKQIFEEKFIVDWQRERETSLESFILFQ